MLVLDIVSFHWGKCDLYEPGQPEVCTHSHKLKFIINWLSSSRKGTLIQRNKNCGPEISELSDLRRLPYLVSQAAHLPSQTSSFPLSSSCLRTKRSNAEICKSNRLLLHVHITFLINIYNPGKIQEANSAECLYIIYSL